MWFFICLLKVEVLHHLHIPAKALFKRNEGFCSFDPFYFLQLVMQHIPQLRNILTDNFCKHAVIACCIIKPHYLWYFLRYRPL